MIPSPDAFAPALSASHGSASTTDFLIEVPEYLAVTRRMFEEVKELADITERQQRTREVYRRIQGLATTTALGGLPVAGQIGSSLATLLKKLCDNPNTLTPSTLNTVCKAILLLEKWCVPGVEEKFAGHPPIRLLVVEDEPLAKRAVMGTLQQVFEKPESAANGTAALALVMEKPYDVIFTDVQMPLMDGFELCTSIRASDLNHRTPVVFISACNDSVSHARGFKSGGTDFIAKPFLPIEMTVKALTFAWEARLQQLDGNQALSLESVQSFT
jgi:CheY-like chemotaxis protein